MNIIRCTRGMYNNNNNNNNNDNNIIMISRRRVETEESNRWFGVTFG